MMQYNNISKRMGKTPLVLGVVISALLLGVLVTLLPAFISISILLTLVVTMLLIRSPIYLPFLIIILVNGLFVNLAIPLAGGSIGVSDILVLVIIIYLLPIIVHKRLMSTPGYGGLLAVLLFTYFLVILSLFFSVLVYHNPIRDVLAELRPFLYWMLALFVMVLATDKKRLHFMCFLFFLVGVLFSVTVNVQVIFDIPLVKGRLAELNTVGTIYEDVRRATGSSVYLALFSFFYSIFVKPTSKVKIILRYVAIVSCSLTIFFNFGRGIWFASAVSYVMASFLINKKNFVSRFFWDILGFSLFIVVFFAVNPNYINAAFDRLTSVGSELSYGTSLEWRQIENEFAVKKIVESGFMGIGLGGAYKPFLDKNLPEQQVRHIHNSFLYYILKLGILGGAIPILLFYLQTRAIFKISVSCKNTEAEVVLPKVIYSVMLIPYVVSFTQPEFMETSSVAFMSVCIGLLLSFYRVKFNDY